MIRILSATLVFVFALTAYTAEPVVSTNEVKRVKKPDGNEYKTRKVRTATILGPYQEYDAKYGEPTMVRSQWLGAEQVIVRAYIKEPFVIMTYSMAERVVCIVYKKASGAITDKKWTAMTEDERAAIVDENAPEGARFVEVPTISDNIAKGAWMSFPNRGVIACYRSSDFMLLISKVSFDPERVTDTK